MALSPYLVRACTNLAKLRRSSSGRTRIQFAIPFQSFAVDVEALTSDSTNLFRGGQRLLAKKLKVARNMRIDLTDHSCVFVSH